MASTVFPVANGAVVAPSGLTLQQTITSGTSVTIPTGVNWVYAIVIGGGAGPGYTGGSGRSGASTGTGGSGFLAVGGANGGSGGGGGGYYGSGGGGAILIYY